jgi:prepilin-type processing-associated H-X9-DG protein
LSKAWSGSNLYDSDVNLKNRIKKLRGKQIKDILVKENINVRGMIEKSEFEAELFKAEMKYLEKSSYLKSSIQLKKVAFPNMQKSYVAVEAKIQNQLCTFLIDTGATINAINSQTAKLLQLSSYPQARYSHGLGGGSKIASSYTILDRMTIGTKEFYHTKADILDYDTFLPPGTCGILGINFFREQHNNDLYLFDFHQSILEIAPYQGILSPMNKMNFKRVNGKRIANILFADASVTSLTNHHCKVLGMVDIGSSYTMINLSAVRTLGYNPDTLPLSNVYCTGIDGKPFQVRSL